MTISGLQKLTLIDYPGKLAATVFLSGCNFYCPWCYSSELVLPEKIKHQPKIAEKDFFSFLEEKIDLIEGVVICGGEPTLHNDLPRFISKIKKLGYSVKLDTNGSNPKMVKSLIDKNLVDYVAMDIKGISHDFQKEIERSVELLKNSGVDFEFRTTVVPTVLKKEDIVQIAKWIGGENVKYYLQQFRPEKTIDPNFEKIKPYSEKYLLAIKKAISPFFKTCEIR
ncbi:anaerobic ribonucleoside-triphosphate reductase activating protein [Parcubacteria bacterium DG_72]|nr:MAG: anaerobic ribonucleoside-triphosphate reductase activating protein [Parcubacteria bacterium DG_72]